MSQGTRNASPESIKQAHDVALAAVTRGWRPLPITADGRKVPLVRFTSENGTNLAASSAADVYTLWLEEYRGAGVAVVTGPVEHEGSGLLVIDVDVKADAPGLASLSEAFAELGPLPPTMVVRSPSGGFHYVYRYPEHAGDAYRNWNGWRPGIDVRGWHGIAAIPGSTDVRGTYTLEPGHPTEPAELSSPAWLAALVKPAADLAQREEFQGRELDSDSPELRRQRVIAAQEIEILCAQLATPGPGKHGRLVFCATAAGSWAHLLGEREAVEPWLTGRLLDALRAAHVARGGHIDERKSARDVAQLVHNGMVNPKWAPAVPVTLLGNVTDYGLSLEPLAPRLDRSLDPAAWRTWDDLGNAQRLAATYGDQIAWVRDAGQWIAYHAPTGSWTLASGDVMAQHFAVETVSAMTDREVYDDPDTREAFAKFATKSRSAGAISAMVKLARSQSTLWRDLEEFDAHPLRLNVRNGVLDLVTGELAPHSPAAMVTQVAGTVWEPGARSSRWVAFLEEMQPDPEVRAYLQRVVGYTLTGSNAEQSFFLHVGHGANGKSVFIETLAKMLGTYAQAIPKSALMLKEGDDGIPNDVARMRGKRLLRASETSAGKKLNVELLKRLSGGDTVTARHMRAEFFEFVSVGKIHLTTNFPPHLDSGGHSVGRRLHEIGWDVTIADERKDLSLPLKLAQELPGILAWAVEGVAAWLDGGLRMPEAVRRRGAEHLEGSDPLADWLETRLERIPGAECELQTLYVDYRAHAEARGERPMAARSMSAALTERGFETYKGQPHRRVVVRNVTLRLTPLQEAAGQGYPFGRQNGRQMA